MYEIWKSFIPFEWVLWENGYFEYSRKRRPQMSPWSEQATAEQGFRLGHTPWPDAEATAYGDEDKAVGFSHHRQEDRNTVSKIIFITWLQFMFGIIIFY
jgi:hypothetical protein